MVARSAARCARVLVAIIVVAIWSGGAGTAPARADSLQRWGFYVTYDPASKSSLLSHLGQLSVVVPDYFSLKPPGQIAGTGDAGLDSAIAASGVRELPLVQSVYTGSALSPFLTDARLRGGLIASIDSLAGTAPYAGVTLDFEGISPGDRDAFSTFVRDLAASLHASGKQLAVAIPAADGDYADQWAAAFDSAAIGASADAVILMAYADRTALNPTPGPISPLPWMTTVTRFAASRIPPAKLVLGIGLWGYDWDVSKPGRATVLRYSDIASLMSQGDGSSRFDASSGAPTYTYQRAGHTHTVWFENAQSVGEKVALGQSLGIPAVAFWRLGQEDPGIWEDPSTTSSPDFAIPNGWFFSQTGGSPGLGYRIVDDGPRFWSEFQRLGGVATLGYPCSRPFVGADGFTYQAFQRGLLQWRPDLGEALLANTFDMLTSDGRDASLTTLGIPPSVLDDGSDGVWNQARLVRLGWLTQPAIAAAFYANPNPAAIPTWNQAESVQLYGLPTSLPRRSGPFIVQRFQRISLQLWLDNVPGMPAPGTVVGILGGDLLKVAGIIPPYAATPQAPD